MKNDGQPDTAAAFIAGATANTLMSSGGNKGNTLKRKDGERPATALRTAHAAMRQQKAWQSPYYWAVFAMQGEWR